MLVNNQNFRTIWAENATQCVAQSVFIIDQTQLPHAFEIVEITSVDKMIHAIKSMQVRGAPLIGVAAAYGLALAALKSVEWNFLQQAATALIQSRPTAVNLSWAIKRMLAQLENSTQEHRLHCAWREAKAICDEDVQCNIKIAQHGLAVIKTFKENLVDKTRTINILTHCNAGWLATVDVGTALGPIYAAHDAGLNVHVWVDETRPRNQGASLTAWELGQHGVPYTVISDNAGGHLMQQEHVDMVIVGADRITNTGDVCNKIGTYLKALSAADNHIPFYVAAPNSTIDRALSNGLLEIPIEYRDGDEVRFMQGMTAENVLTKVRILPASSATLNPAFDVTPARLVTGIISEHGLFKPEALKHSNTMHDD